MYRDGASAAIRVPRTAEEWTALGYAAPSSGALLQESGEPMTDSYGARPVDVSGTVEYQQAGPSGWTGYFVHTTETAAEGAWWTNSSGINPALHSIFALCYVKFTTITGTRSVLRLGVQSATVGGGGLLCRITSGGLPQSLNNGATVNGAVDHRDGAVHPVGLGWNLATGVLDVYTDLESVTGPVDNSVVTDGAVKGIGGAGGASPPDALWRCMYWWVDTDATDIMADVSTFYEALGWTVAW